MGSSESGWLRGLWRYYLAYTRTPIHAASAAALAILGLLAVVDDRFVVLAVAAYVLPPVALYALGDDRPGGSHADRGRAPSNGADSSRVAPESTRAVAEMDSDTDRDDGDGDSDTDSDGGDGDSDSDSDGGDGDTDTDAASDRNERGDVVA